MKAAISVPDELFEAADQLARELGMSRSELYARAVALFLEQRCGAVITEKLDEVYGTRGSDLDPVLDALQIRSLPDGVW